MKLGWFDALGGETSWREIEAINSAAEGVAMLQQGQEGLANQIGRLVKLSVAQEQEIDELKLTVDVLVDLLVDTLGLDPTQLKYRLEAAFAELEAARAEARSKGAMVQCTSCGAQVRARQTTITVTGVVCDACVAGG